MNETMEQSPPGTASGRFRWLKKLAITFAGLFAVVFFGLRSLESAMTFHPTRVSPGDRWTAPRGCEEVWMTARTGNRIHGCYLRGEGEIAASILHAHGNGGDIRNVFWVSERLAKSGFNVLVFDYEGYGRSEGSLPNEDGLFADGDAAYDYLVRERQVPGERIALYGQSLGTTIVTDLAARRKCGALVVESGLSSAADMAATRLPLLPSWLYWIGRFRFESARKIAHAGCPVMVIHGTADRTIAFSHGQKLFRSANEPKRWLEIPGGGHWLPRNANGRHLNEVASFIRSATAGKN